MTKLLVLMRHGKAEPRNARTPDESRPLTEAGRRALKAQLPRMLSLLGSEHCGISEVWASPAVRTRQTAEEVASAIGTDGVRLCDHLLTQDLSAFLDEVRASSADCIVAVGHNPFVEAAVLALCGAAIPFSTGALAAVRIEETPGTPRTPKAKTTSEQDVSSNRDEPSPVLESAPETPEGLATRLLWFVQGPQARNWKTFCLIEQIVACGMGRAEARLAEFLRTPNDVEALHDLRVAIRTLRSLVSFVEPYQGKAQNRALQADLKAAVVETSRLREYDVLLEQINKLDAPSFDLQALCAAKREKERDRVVKELWGKRLTQALSRAHDVAYHMRWRQRVEQDGLPAETLRQRFDMLREAFDSNSAHTDLRDIEAAHDLRKSAKRLRYIAEAFKGVLGEDRAAHAAQMVRAQDSLGELCDAYATAEILKTFAAEDLTPSSREVVTMLYALNKSTIKRLAPPLQETIDA